MPGEYVVIVPKMLSTAATAGAALDQVPPGVTSVNADVLPKQTGFGYTVGVSGFGLTVTTILAEYISGPDSLMVTVPAVIPVSIPEELPMVATAVLLLAQTDPPDPGSLRDVVEPTQTEGVPSICAREEKANRIANKVMYRFFIRGKFEFKSINF